jgi:hypothetical protein
VQFHPEASPALMHDWAVEAGEDVAAIDEVVAAHDEAVAAAGRTIARTFAEIVVARATSRAAA